MKQYKKIDLYFNGDYLFSTTWHKTCKAAIQSVINDAEVAKHSFCGTTRIQDAILKNPKGLKAYLDKDRK